ncbi:unnamed protein product, partial [Mesorhabditis belari]|uniref:Uncharacterized protein n=1 Tax=Mesorhabditis belari TaxID=2138241 RepID=A0AAF3F9Z0_9BILA
MVEREKDSFDSLWKITRKAPIIEIIESNATTPKQSTTISPVIPPEERKERSWLRNYRAVIWTFMLLISAIIFLAIMLWEIRHRK